jgi:hypothetical protein
VPAENAYDHLRVDGAATCMGRPSVPVKTLEELDEIVPGAQRQYLGIDASGKSDGDSKLRQVGGAVGAGSKMAFEASMVSSAE